MIPQITWNIWYLFSKFSRRSIYGLPSITCTYVIVKNSFCVCIILNLRFKLRAPYALRLWQLSVYIAWSFALASAWIGNDRADPWKANTPNIGYTSARCTFMLFVHDVANTVFKTRASAHTRGELLPTCPFQFTYTIEFFVELFFFRMIARTFGKFPPRNAASGWAIPKTATRTQWFSTRYCCFATSNPRT